MITSLPSVQFSCKRARRFINRADSKKRSANRRHRRVLAQVTGRMRLDPERFYDETFDAPSLSLWDII